MDEKLILSICIPVYNGGNRLVKNVFNILKYKKNDIEIIVSDNRSNDGSIEKLQEIQDKRLKIYVNEENIGPFKNWYLALKRGRGKYLKLLLDRDILQVEVLQDYVEMIRDMEYGIILDWAGRLGCGSNRILTKREKMYWLVSSEHPSICTYLRSAFEEIKDSRVCDQEGSGSCNVFWGISMAMVGCVLVNCECPIYIDAQTSFFVLTSSRTWGYTGRAKACGLEPTEYERKFAFYLEHIFLLESCSEETIIGLYEGLLPFVSPQYHDLICSTSMKHRYEIKDENYSLDRYSQLPFEFFKKVKKILKQRGLLTLKIGLELWFITFVNYMEFCNKNCSQMRWHMQFNHKVISFIRKKRNLTCM